MTNVNPDFTCNQNQGFYHYIFGQNIKAIACLLARILTKINQFQLESFMGKVPRQ